MIGRHRIVGIALAQLALAACREPDLPPHRVDLSSSDAGVRRWSETRALDLGTAAARAALWDGWGPDEQGEATTFAWSGGDSSRLEFRLTEARALEISLRGWAYPFPDGLGVDVEILVNGEKVDRLTVPPTPTRFRVQVPRGALAVGANLLELRSSRHHRSEGEPPWAVAWDGMTFGAPRGARTGTGGGAVAQGSDVGVPITAGSAVEWRVELPGGSAVAWDGAERLEGARLFVDVARAEGGTSTAEIGRGAGRIALPDPGSPPDEAAIVTLRATGEAGRASVRGLRLHRASAPDAAPSIAEVAGTAVQRPSFVIYLIDTLRADRLGCYGYPRPTSPRIDEFARGATLFRAGRAQSSWTRPAVASILTGEPPWKHGVEERSSSLPASFDTLAERLQRAGYATAIFTTNANIVPRFGFDQGWDEFHALFEREGRSRRHVDSATIHREVVRWFDRRAASGDQRPFLLFVHTLDPHAAYLPAEPFRAQLAADVEVELGCCSEGATARGAAAASLGESDRARAHAASRLYDAEIAQNDHSFGELLDELERRGLAASTGVLLTSDHGEEFLEHGGWKHGWTLFEEMLRVPFVLRPPGPRHGRIVEEAEGSAEQVDVVPTLLALAGLQRDPDLPGRDLLASSVGPRSASIARLVRGGVVLESMRRGAWKLIRRSGEWTPPLGEPRLALFDARADPAELLDRAWERNAPRQWLEAELERGLALDGEGVAAETTAIEAELDEALRALGYL